MLSSFAGMMPLHAPWPKPRRALFALCLGALLLHTHVAQAAWAEDEGTEASPPPPLPSVSDAPPEATSDTPPEAASATSDSDAKASPALTPRQRWELGLFAGGLVAVFTGVTLVTVNHARVDDYNLGVKAYNQGVDATPSTLSQLADMRDSINSGERWGYVAGSVGLAAAVAAGVLFVLDRPDGMPAAGVAAGPSSITFWGHF